MQEYLDAIHSRVCPVCLDAVMAGKNFLRCGLPTGRTCPVETYLPQVINVTEWVQSPLLEDYVPVLRKNVCAICAHDENGFCALRVQADCALDRYFMLVAEALDEVRARHDAEAATVGIP